MKVKKYLSNKRIAHLLKSVAAAYEIKQENRFKINAYEVAADSIEQATEEIVDLWENKQLKANQ